MAGSEIIAGTSGIGVLGVSLLIEAAGLSQEASAATILGMSQSAGTSLSICGWIEAFSLAVGVACGMTPTP